MRLMLALSTALMAISTIGCADAPLAPRLDEEIVLAPFANEVMYIQPSYMCGNCAFGNSMKFYAPVGVDPVVDFVVKNITTNTPAVKVEIFRRPDPDNVCSNTSCTRVAWIVDLSVRTEKIGEFDISVFLRSNPEKKTSVRVVSAEYFGGKG